MTGARLFGIMLATPALALAHAGEPLRPHDFWGAWTFDAGVIVPLMLTAALYWRGTRPPRMSGRPALFWWGWTTLALALISPLHALGETLFSAHMVQHEVLMLIAAPLLVLSRPLAPLLFGLPASLRRPAGRVVKLVSLSPLAAWWVHGIAIWMWHAPFLFQATLRSEWIHAAQHISFFVSALLFWWALSQTSYGAGVLYVFTTGVHTSILGALLTFAPQVLYPSYNSTVPWGLTPLEDQQTGGLIMWVPAGLIYLVAGLGLFSRWLRQSDAKLATTIAAAVILCGCGGKAARASAVLTGGDPQRGKTVIGHYGCGTCHTIGGISSAVGLVGPPLTGMARRTYVAGMLRNTPENLEHWIRHPREVNPKTAMPDTGVTADDAADIAAYLYTIK